MISWIDWIDWIRVPLDPPIPLNPRLLEKTFHPTDWIRLIGFDPLTKLTKLIPPLGLG